MVCFYKINLLFSYQNISLQKANKLLTKDTNTLFEKARNFRKKINFIFKEYLCKFRCIDLLRLRSVSVDCISPSGMTGVDGW